MSYIGDVRDVLLELVPEGTHPELLRMFLLLTLSKGGDTTLFDVHQAWCLWMTRTEADHSFLVPFEHLPREVTDLDVPFVEAIHRAAEMMAVRH